LSSLIRVSQRSRLGQKRSRKASPAGKKKGGRAQMVTRSRTIHPESVGRPRSYREALSIGLQKSILSSPSGRFDRVGKSRYRSGSWLESEKNLQVQANLSKEEGKGIAR